MNYYKSQLKKINANALGTPAKVLITKDGVSTNYISLNNNSATELVNWLKENYIIREFEESIVEGWSVEDVFELATEENINITREQAIGVLKLVAKEFDSTQGVTWDTINWALTRYLKNEQ